MTDNLVKRLRGEGLWFTEDAADEIERLRSILSRLVEPVRESKQLFGAQHLHHVRIGADLIEEIIGAVKGKTDG